MSDEIQETVYNLFVFVTDDQIADIGVVSHTLGGSDEYKLNRLQQLVAEDVQRAKHYPAPQTLFSELLSLSGDSNIAYEIYSYVSRTGNPLLLFTEVLDNIKAPPSPLFCITPIVDGVPVIDMESRVGAADGANVMIQKQFATSIASYDYLAKYTRSGALHMHDLLGDDFLNAIKLLFNQRHYVSAAKLLVSFIDTVSYLEFGDIRDCCKLWLSQYADLSRVGISPSEFWEFRNGLLHTTSPFSRKVIEGKEARLTFNFSFTDRQPRHDPETNSKSFSFIALYDEMLEALGRWVSSYRGNLSKQLELIRRYDEVLSENRLGTMIRQSKENEAQH